MLLFSCEKWLHSLLYVTSLWSNLSLHSKQEEQFISFLFAVAFYVFVCCSFAPVQTLLLETELVFIVPYSLCLLNFLQSSSLAFK